MQSQACLSYAETSDLAEHNAKLALVLLRRRKFAKGNRDKVRRSQLGILRLSESRGKTRFYYAERKQNRQSQLGITIRTVF